MVRHWLASLWKRQESVERRAMRWISGQQAGAQQRGDLAEDALRGLSPVWPEAAAQLAGLES